MNLIFALRVRNRPTALLDSTTYVTQTSNRITFLDTFLCHISLSHFDLRHISPSHFSVTFLRHISSSHFSVTFLRHISSSHFSVTFLRHISPSHFPSHFSVTFLRHISPSHFSVTFLRHIFRHISPSHFSVTFWFVVVVVKQCSTLYTTKLAAPFSRTSVGFVPFVSNEPE